MRLLLLASFCLLKGSKSTHFLIETADLSTDTDDTADTDDANNTNDTPVFPNGPNNFSGNDDRMVKESGLDYEEEEEHKAVANDNRVKNNTIDLEDLIHPHHSKSKYNSTSHPSVSPIIGEDSSGKSSQASGQPKESGNDYKSETKAIDHKSENKGNKGETSTNNHKSETNENRKSSRRKKGTDYMGGLEAPWRNNLHNFNMIEEVQDYMDSIIDWRRRI